jgi:co-chaperonin GroES (HSP10)
MSQDNQQTEFEKAFATLREMKGSFFLRGSTIIVYELPDVEIKTEGGLVIVTNPNQVMGNSVEQHRLKVAKVLMVGPGYWSDEAEFAGTQGSYLPVEVQPGAIVILPQYSTSTISVFPGINKPTGNKLHMIKEDSILAYYPSQEAYETALAKLN